MTVSTQPDPQMVATRAAEIFTALTEDEGYPRLAESAQMYADCWATFTGYPVICEWSEEADKAPLFAEGLRLLALKSAVFELTGGDERAAELLASAPVDEMVHAILAQHTLAVQMQQRCGITLVHMTDTERWGYSAGDYTYECYRLAYGTIPPERYWIGKQETARRLAHLRELYGSIGIDDLGRSHTINFENLPAPAAA